MKRPATLLFDLGGVLIRTRAKERLGTLLSGTRTWPQIQQALLDDPNFAAFERGQRSPAAFAQGFVDAFDLELSPTEFLEDFRTWPLGFYSGAEALLGSLRQHYSVACLSNINSVHWRDEWADRFDRVFASHQLGLVKPEAALFELVLDELPAGPVCFFDDAEANVQAASAAGMLAFQVRGFDELVAALRRQSLWPI